jgi:hypothetical protein
MKQRTEPLPASTSASSRGRRGQETLPTTQDLVPTSYDGALFPDMEE